jgi:hypothetical protein
VIPVEQVDRTARPFRFLLESLEQQDHSFLFVAPVEDVAGLHYDEVASDPPVIRVDGPSQAEGQPGCPEVPMQVSDGNDALGGIEPSRQPFLDWGVSGASRQSQSNEWGCQTGGNEATAHRGIPVVGGQAS